MLGAAAVAVACCPLKRGKSIPPRCSAQERNARTAAINVMQDLGKHLPLYVWLVALPQLTSRVCHAHAETQRITQHILTRVTAAFPHQVCRLAQSQDSFVSAHHSACMRSNDPDAAHALHGTVRAAFIVALASGITFYCDAQHVLLKNLPQRP